jgi:A/G-specific adenine glycosylase
VRHGYSHFRITLYAFACDYISGTPQKIGVADFAWVTLGDLEQYAFPVTDQKIITLLRHGGGQLGMDLG